MSEHYVFIIEVDEVVPHPDPEVHSLELTNVKGWQCVVPKGAYKQGDHAVYIEPDYVVDTTRPEFAFLDKKGNGKPHRLRAVRLRNAASYGLIIPVPDSLREYPVGSDVREQLGIIRYEPPISAITRSEAVPGPSLQKFDLENIQNYPRNFEVGEHVFVTEKIHGTNAKFMFDGEKVHVGSRNQWVRDTPTCLWWRAYRQYPGIADYIHANPHHVLFGEIYGDVQEMKYGHNRGEIAFAAFAILDTQTQCFLNADDCMYRTAVCDVPHAPLLWEGPWPESLTEVYSLAEENTIVGGEHLMEGIVITPRNERSRWDIGRLAFKHISQRYWLKS